MQYFIKNLILLSFIFFSPFIIADEMAKDMYLAEKVAAGNDWIIDKGQRTPLLKPFT